VRGGCRDRSGGGILQARLHVVKVGKRDPSCLVVRLHLEVVGFRHQAVVLVSGMKMCMKGLVDLLH
jgi:hypothetical protein